MTLQSRLPAYYWLILLAVSAGCVPVSKRFDRAATDAGLVRSQVEGRGFSHAVYRPRDSSFGTTPVHVYLTGDGTPYVRRTLRAKDPTPRRPVVLDLMALDPAPRLLLGRPCYHGLARTRGCGPDLWTQGRFGEQVLASMAATLARLLPEARPLVLIGFSGGGAIAVLLARRLPNVVGVVTLAGNLDTDAWADLHGYGRLAGSENPVHGVELPPMVKQLHFAGRDDRIVPPSLILSAAPRLGGQASVLPATTHRHGWRSHWPAILDEIETWGTGGVVTR